MYRPERWNDREAALEWFEAHEPTTTPQAAILTHQDISRAVRVWRAVDESGTIGGTLVEHRRVRDRWDAHPFLVDTAAASALAEVVDAGPAELVSGRGDHVTPIASQLTRYKRSLVTPFTALEVPFPDLGDPDPRVRLAVEDDLHALVELYSGYEIDDIPTRRRWRTYLRPFIERRQLRVVDDDGHLVGAMSISYGSRRWWFVGSLTVVPEARGQQLGWELIKHGIATVDTLQPELDGAIVSQAVTNPMEGRSVDADLEAWLAEDPGRSIRDRAIPIVELALDAVLVQASLRPQIRFPGHARARRLLELVEGATVKRSPELAREPTRVEDLDRR